MPSVGTFSVPGCTPASGASKSFTIYNEGGQSLDVSSLALNSPAPWISWTPGASQSVAGGSSRQVTVTVDFDKDRLAPLPGAHRRKMEVRVPYVRSIH